MKSISSVLAGIVGLVSTLPTLETEPLRVLPPGWQFTLVKFEGPGCPANNGTGYDTRLTFGENTTDGSEEYYWWVAYPHLKGTVGTAEAEVHSWCEATFKYNEYSDWYNKNEASDYLFRLHKNGSGIITTYDLEDGVTAKWKLTYYPEDGDEIVDTTTVNGPLNDVPYGDKVVAAKGSKPVASSQCGATTFKFRTDLFLTSNKKGAKGTVIGEEHKFDDGKTYSYGSQSGFSYDWQKCAK